MFDNTNKSLSSSVLLLLLLIAGGCSKSFVVTSEVPKPLIERMPVTAKMVYTEEFRNYVYIEAGSDRALEKVDFGNAQVGMFNRVFTNLLTLVEPASTDYDLKIEPQILDFQYSVPAETKLNMYEIWLKYRLKITDSSDREVADWVVKGYGKTPTSMLASQLKAFNTASNVALRDVGAQLAIGFSSQPSIEDYLAGRKSPAEVSGLDPEIENEVTGEIETQDKNTAQVSDEVVAASQSEEVVEEPAVAEEEE